MEDPARSSDQRNYQGNNSSRENLLDVPIPEFERNSPRFSDHEEVAVLLKRHREHEGKNLVSSERTLMNILKSMIGPGCLALPLAFKYCGLWTGLVLTFITGLLNIYCMEILVKCAQFLCSRSGKIELDYGHMAKKAFDFGDEKIQMHSKIALYVTNVVICIYQLGVCSVQFVFMGANLQKVLNFFDPHITLQKQSLISILLLPVMLLCFVRHLRLLAILATIGNICLLIGFVIVFQHLVQPPWEFMIEKQWFETFDGLVLFLGSVLYALEGQAVILPMENKMKHPGDMLRRWGVLQTSMLIVTSIYCATGFYGYAKFGNEVKGSITLNMPNEALYQIVNLTMVLAVFLGYSLQFYVIIEMLWPAIVRKMPQRVYRYHPLLEYIFRALIVLLPYCLAMLVPNLDAIIPLVGTTAGMLISFIFPPLLEILTFWKIWTEDPLMTKRKKNTKLLVNFALISLGVFGLISGLYSSIRNINRTN